MNTMNSRKKFMSLRLLKPLLLVSLWMPLLAQASFMPAHLIDGFANIISWIVLIVLPIGFIALFWFVHIWPDTVAKRRQHPQRDAIHALCVLSLFFGGLLWPFAYLWAYTRPTMYKLAYGTDRYSPVEEDQVNKESDSSKA
jgi:CBS domain containing-hemolysin-like protein